MNNLQPIPISDASLTQIDLGYCSEGRTSTALTPWLINWDILTKQLSAVKIGDKDGDYFTRAEGTHRSNETINKVASILILDGDSRISQDGEILSGAPNPEQVHSVLKREAIPHVIYSSHSNGMTEAELTAKGVDSGGLFGADYHKYRVVIPCKYTREQLPALLNRLFDLLHTNRVQLAPVKENSTWSQAWYFPRVPDEARLKLFKKFVDAGDSGRLDVAAIAADYAAKQVARVQAASSKAVTSYAKHSAKHSKDGRRNPIVEFNQSFALEEVLLRCGYSQVGERWRRPGSDSGVPGVVICKACSDGVERVFSFGNDALNDGNAHDAFDIYRLLECDGDEAKALNWNPDITKHNQRFFKENNRALQTSGGFQCPSLPGTSTRDGTANTRALTELGNAYRLADAYGENTRYVYDAHAWLIWESGAWSWDLEGAVIRSNAAQLPQQIYAEAHQYLKDAKSFVTWALASQRETTIKAAVSLFKDSPAVRIPLAMMDADLYRVGLDGGRSVLDLKSGETRPAQQTDYITKSLNVAVPGVASKAKRWHEFLKQVFSEDVELIDWVQRWCGYLLTGSTTEQCFVFCYGSGKNGKSVLAGILEFILGDYYRPVAIETLLVSKRQAGGATPDLAELIGARLAVSSETEDGGALAESLIKSLVGGDRMPARRMYADPVQFTPQFKLMMLGNHKPIVRGCDYAIWRRVRLIPFTRTFEGEACDKQLSAKLRAEAPHILAWMVEGCLTWQRNGLGDTPASVEQATSEYREEQDLIGLWLAECCEEAADSWAGSTRLYLSYSTWCNNNGLRPGSAVAPGRKLSDRGFTSSKVKQVRGWNGLKLR